jgi:hypothetical protein
MEEIAQTLDVSLRTVQSDWAFARVAIERSPIVVLNEHRTLAQLQRIFSDARRFLRRARRIRRTSLWP